MVATLTDGELKVLQLAMQCYKTQPEVDYDRLAQVGGYKTKASANAVYYSAKKKMLAGADGAASSKKRAAGEDADGAKQRPKKRGRKSKAEIAGLSAEVADGEEGEAKEVKEEERKVKEEEPDDEIMEGLLRGARDFLATCGDEEDEA